MYIPEELIDIKLNMKNIVVFTGAGISEESGLKTFRGEGGLWEGYRVEEVATPEAWHSNPELVQRFYNIRRKDCLKAQPNKAHLAIVELEKDFNVEVITQNIDDLHERAGSKNVLHLHGEVRKSQSSVDSNLVYPIKGDELKMGETCEKGSQLRPHIVWFGEAVPMMTEAIDVVQQADIFIVIGTSLQVYPAANLIHYVKKTCEIYVIDPNADTFKVPTDTTIISEKAVKGMETLKEILTEEYSVCKI